MRVLQLFGLAVAFVGSLSLQTVEAVTLSQEPYADDALTTCSCTYGADQLYNLPDTQPSVISLKSDPTQCWLLSKTVGSRTCDGLCVYLGPCGSDAPQWKIVHQDDYDLIQVTSAGPSQGWCLDQNTVLYYVQAYQCLSGDTHQTWTVSNNSIIELWDGAAGCVASTGPLCKKPTPPGAEFCPRYHVVQDNNLYDPSGPLLTPDGTWHVWEDNGGWSHYSSKDLIRWLRIAPPSTGFSGLTGSISVTPSGFFAFWPVDSQASINTAAAADAPDFTGWEMRGPAINAPPIAGGNFRDPVRAFSYQGSWYVGVGCNNQSKSADLCIFKASNDSLSNFTFAGSMFTVLSTFGQMNSDIAWVNQSVAATMMECPDVFQIGPDGLWMIIGSLFSTNQWWIGNVSGNPPRFTPSAVGLMDYGNGYAVKTGSTYAANPIDRRVQFAFTGWNEPTKVPACGRAFILPRDIIIKHGLPRFYPIPETQSLKLSETDVTQTGITSRSGVVDLVKGAQAYINVFCNTTWSAKLDSIDDGAVFVRVLGAQSGEQYTEIGYSFAMQALYSDQSHCCLKPNAIIQTAPLYSFNLGLDGFLNMTVFVDGSLIEIFLQGQRTITTLVNPDTSTSPDARTNSFQLDVSGLVCDVQSWKLAALI